MEETQQLTAKEGDGDETLVTPRFDEEEAETAQPVIPLAAASSDGPEPFSATTPPPYVVAGRGPRRSWPLALVLVSALVGSVLGGAGLYFYQKRQQQQGDNTTAVTTEPQPSVETGQTLPAAPPEDATASVPDTASAAPPAGEDVAETSVRPAVMESEGEDEDADDSRRPEARAKESAAAPAHKSSEASQPVAVVKHGKKGERDDDAERRDERPRRAGITPQTVRPDDEGNDEAEARRVDTITYRRERRRARRGRREGEGRVVDRVRGIFEGQPER